MQALMAATSASTIASPTAHSAARSAWNSISWSTRPARRRDSPPPRRTERSAGGTDLSAPWPVIVTVRRAAGPAADSSKRKPNRSASAAALGLSSSTPNWVANASAIAASAAARLSARLSSGSRRLSFHRLSSGSRWVSFHRLYLGQPPAPVAPALIALEPTRGRAVVGRDDLPDRIEPHDRDRKRVAVAIGPTKPSCACLRHLPVLFNWPDARPTQGERHARRPNPAVGRPP